MRETYEPSRCWRLASFRLNPEPFLKDLDKYNPQLPLSHALSSEEVREQVHENLNSGHQTIPGTKLPLDSGEEISVIQNQPQEVIGETG